MIKADYIIKSLDELYPDAHCELNYKSNFELLIAVVLSAQTTDIKVNKVTKVLFDKYPDVFSLACANLNDVEEIIKPLGLYHNKAKNIINLSKVLVDKYNGEVINDCKALESLSGVGHKSANIVLNNCYGVPAFAVDTHVSRVSKRLGIADKDDDVKTLVHEVASNTSFWDRDLTLIPGFEKTVVKYLNDINSNGAYSVMKEVIK